MTVHRTPPYTMWVVYRIRDAFVAICWRVVPPPKCLVETERVTAETLDGARAKVPSGWVRQSEPGDGMGLMVESWVPAGP
jgi:hypothetical protein